MATVLGEARWSAESLNTRIERGERFFVLDLRNREEFDASRIEGRGGVVIRNVPYFEMLEAGGGDDFVGAIAGYARANLLAELPNDGTILAVCAKGDTSALVAQALSRLGLNAASLTGGMKAWGDFLCVRVAVESADDSIYQAARPARGCLSYVVASDGRAVVVDPLRHIEPYVNLLRKQRLAIELVIDTHGHADHISGGPALARRFGVPYCLHPYDAIHPIDLLPAADRFTFLKDGWEHAFGRTRVRALHIPGHTLGNVALLVGERYLLSGDSIFVRSLARPDLGGRGETWAPLHFRSLVRLLELPDATIVLPGHFSERSEADERGVFAAPLGELRARNDGLRMVARGEATFVKYMLDNLPVFPKEYVKIKRVNAGLVHPDEEQASELELGKNICALSCGQGSSPN
jgi:glyoxylase-like metal-dependent hydrolase (beta-lactamase superfamily II)